jgi:hypothetical protein
MSKVELSVGAGIDDSSNSLFIRPFKMDNPEKLAT